MTADAFIKIIVLSKKSGGSSPQMRKNREEVYKGRAQECIGTLEMRKCRYRKKKVRKVIWKRGKRLRSMMMVWHGGGVSFLPQGIEKREGEIWRAWKVPKDSRGREGRHARS